MSNTAPLGASVVRPPERPTRGRGRPRTVEEAAPTSADTPGDWPDPTPDPAPPPQPVAPEVPETLEHDEDIVDGELVHDVPARPGTALAIREEDQEWVRKLAEMELSSFKEHTVTRPMYAAVGTTATTLAPLLMKVGAVLLIILAVAGVIRLAVAISGVDAPW